MRRPKMEKKGSHERWLVTYADMITLLLIFFIVMYTLSRIDIAKWQYLSRSLSQALGAGGMVLDNPGPSVVPGVSGAEPDSAPPTAETAQLEALKKELETYIEQAQLSAKVSVTSEERGVVLSFQEEVLFTLGSAELTPGAKVIIHKIGPIFKKVPNYIRVEGHTDNLPIHTAQYPSNWELSSARATNVLRELIKSFKLQPERLSAVAYAEFRPRAPNDSNANRQLNRRVNIVILRNKFKMAEPGTVNIAPVD